MGVVNAIGNVPVYFPAPARDTYSGLNVALAPACVPFPARAFLRGGMMACAWRSAIAAWHALVS